MGYVYNNKQCIINPKINNVHVEGPGHTIKVVRENGEIKTIYKYQARDPKGHKARRLPDGISILTAVPAGPAMKWAPTCLMMLTQLADLSCRSGNIKLPANARNSVKQGRAGTLRIYLSIIRSPRVSIHQQRQELNNNTNPCVQTDVSNHSSIYNQAKHAKPETKSVFRPSPQTQFLNQTTPNTPNRSRNRAAKTDPLQHPESKRDKWRKYSKGG